MESSLRVEMSLAMSSQQITRSFYLGLALTLDIGYELGMFSCYLVRK